MTRINVIWNIDKLANFTADVCDSMINSKIYQEMINKKRNPVFGAFGIS